MERITLRQLLDALESARLLGEERDLTAGFTGVDTDSRKIRPGSLYIPLSGERFDGHDFIPAALAAGAAGCLTEKEPEELVPGKVYVKVSNTLMALRELAWWYRKQFRIPFICVTGSVGKTTTKDMVAAVLGASHRVHKTAGNFNNHIGVPLTLLELDRQAEFCVLELGMNHPGEIGYLSDLALPDVGLITNVGDAHIENLGSRENILRAKCEIMSGMWPGSTLILNGDDPLLSTLRDTVPYDLKFVGTGEGLDLRATEVRSTPAGLSCRITTPNGAFPVEIPAPGSHMIYPALMAAAVGERFGLTGEEIARGIAQFRPTGMRMNVTRLAGDVVLLNDAYNANPQSMEAAAAVLGEATGRRRVAVVGDMLELGGMSEHLHRWVGGIFAAHGVERLIAVGELGRFIADGAEEAGVAEVSRFPDVDSALPAVREELRPGTTILVKASRAMHFERIADDIISGEKT